MRIACINIAILRIAVTVSLNKKSHISAIIPAIGSKNGYESVIWKSIANLKYIFADLWLVFAYMVTYDV